MAACKLTLCCLYPEILGACGNRGNLAAIVRRCGWRGIATEVRGLRHGDPVRPDDADIILIGDGEDLHRRLIAPDLADVKGPGLREAAGQGAAVLAVGVGYQLLGRFYQPARGAELPGAGLFDAWTIQPAADPGLACGAEAERAAGDLLVRWGDELLVGFEDHRARTYLGPTAQALGQVVMGLGNSGDGHEGVLIGAAVGTYLRGPCLPRNPALADFLIRAALARRYGEADLEPLPDEFERAAHDTAVRRIRIAGRAGTPRPGLARGPRAASGDCGGPHTVGAWTTRRSSGTSMSSSRPSTSCAASSPQVSCPPTRSTPG